jgi:hypothetical protein
MRDRKRAALLVLVAFAGAAAVALLLAGGGGAATRETLISDKEAYALRTPEFLKSTFGWSVDGLTDGQRKSLSMLRPLYASQYTHRNRVFVAKKALVLPDEHMPLLGLRPGQALALRGVRFDDVNHILRGEGAGDNPFTKTHVLRPTNADEFPKGAVLDLHEMAFPEFAAVLSGMFRLHVPHLIRDLRQIGLARQAMRRSNDELKNNLTRLQGEHSRLRGELHKIKMSPRCRNLPRRIELAEAKLRWKVDGCKK